MTQESEKDILNDLMTESCTQLFEAYGTNLSICIDTPTHDVPLDIVGVLGFTGTELRGTLVLGVTSGILNSHHGTAENIPRSMARDWIGELSNQLLGRAKNKLLPYGATIYLSTPVALSGQRIRLLSTDDVEDIGPMLFRADDQYVCIWFEYEVADGFTWELTEDPDNDYTPEGDMLLF